MTNQLLNSYLDTHEAYLISNFSSSNQEEFSLFCSKYGCKFVGFTNELGTIVLVPSKEALFYIYNLIEYHEIDFIKSKIQKLERKNFNSKLKDLIKDHL